MGIMDMFKTAPVVATPAAPGPGQMPTTPAVVATPGNPTSPAAPVVEAPKDTSPMADFADLWKTAPADPNAKGPQPLFNTDPAKLLEAAKKMDFSAVMTPERQALIVAGGADGAAAVREMIQEVAAHTMVQSATTTAAMVEAAVAKSQADFIKAIPSHIKKQNVTESLYQENPALNHPAAQPIVSVIQNTLQVKHPNATTAELREMVSKYFDGLAAAAGAPAKLAADATKAKTANAEDWSKLMGIDS